MGKHSPKNLIHRDWYPVRQVFPESNYDRRRMVILAVALVACVLFGAAIARKANAAVAANGKTIVVRNTVSNPSSFLIAGFSTSAYKILWSVKIPGQKVVTGSTPAQKILHVALQSKSLRQKLLNASSAQLTVQFVPTQPSAGHHLNATVCWNGIHCKAAHT